eukprot:CAMPEP_0179841414 /NCGR_PEP_ID=MMETSP0982-20121206/2518_1 /TAXON_ID=483367 /ORGANISM="non described non described, Strain CCMP 2436" /LENGTH=87 /DNA_ID=CAMNT_0021725493 /DNA_START=636 /DNA_END=899 /DNA_ORIENTATION=+
MLCATNAEQHRIALDPHEVVAKREQRRECGICRREVGHVHRDFARTGPPAEAAGRTRARASWYHLLRVEPLDHGPLCRHARTRAQHV